jgi:peptidoglycan/xylan/chitin deacetylase (PgdA/CDA1 family)
MAGRAPSPSTPADVELAVTVDDLPAHGPLPPGTTRLAVATRLIDALASHRAPGVYGFVNGAPLRANPELGEVLRAWLGAGLPLANHTFSHPDLARVGADEYVADIEENERFLPALASGSRARYFRYTYLSEGNTTAKRASVRAWLAERGYTIAQVTIDPEDWAWNDAYGACASAEGGPAVDRLKAAFLEAARAHLAWSVELSERLFGRQIKHVLLLHMGAFTALVLDELLRSYRAAGVRLIGLDAAVQDPAYRIDPNLVTGRGYTFLSQLSRVRRVGFPAPPSRPP